MMILQLDKRCMTLHTLCVLAVFGVACKLLDWNHVSFNDGQCRGPGCSFEQRGLAGAKEVGAFTFPPPMELQRNSDR